MAPRPAWIFDNSEIDDPRGYGDRAVTFLKALRHPKSVLADQAYELPLFWERIARRIYGPVDADGFRITKVVFILMPRGGRKTTFGAGLGLLHTVGYERTIDGQAIVAASAEDQAALAFKEAQSIVEATPWLSDRNVIRITESNFLIEHPKSGAAFKAVSSDGGAQLGQTPNFVLADELIAWKNRDLWKAVRTGLPKVRGSLLLIITQAGRGQTNLAYEVYEYAKKVESGAVDDPGFLPVIFEPPKGADWRDERIWHMVNPGLSLGFPDIDGLRQLAREAAERPADRDDFKQFNLNFWIDKSASPFVEMDVYDEQADPVDILGFEDKREPCWLAVDLGLVRDLSAIVVVWKRGEQGSEEYDISAWFFCPEVSLRERSEKDKVPYVRWAEEGFIIPTPGEVTDYGVITEFIRYIAIPGHDLNPAYASIFEKVRLPRLNAQEIAFDPAYAKSITGPLLEAGAPVVEMRQGWITMAPAIKELERAILARRFRHGGNPVLRWMFENVMVEVDKANNKSFHKGKSRDRIDGAVAAAMAVARAQLGVLGGFQASIYETPGFLI